MTKTILVTGSAGFIGSHLVDKLISAGHKVIGVDNFNDFYDRSIKVSNCARYFSQEAIERLVSKIISPYKEFQKYNLASFVENFDPNAYENYVSSPGGYTLYGVDLCDYNSLRKIFEIHSITHVVHLAALAGVRPSTEKPILYQRNNGNSTINLLDLAREFKIQKFVFASSSSVYGESPTVPFSENQNISRPISPYAATKASGEAFLHSFYHLYKIPSIALRFFTVYGPRQRPDLAIHKFAKLISSGKEIEVYGDGSARRDFTYIDDILDGVIKAIDLNCGFEIFNLGESQTNDVSTLIKMLETKLGIKAQVKYKAPVPGDVPITYADISKSKSILGYNPLTKLDLGLDKFVEWFKNQ